MTDKMSLEDLYKQETGRTPIAEGCNGCSGYDVDYYDWLETRDAQRESLLAQRTAERDELLILLRKTELFWHQAERMKEIIKEIDAAIAKIQEARP